MKGEGKKETAKSFMIRKKTTKSRKTRSMNEKEEEKHRKGGKKLEMNKEKSEEK